MSFNYDRVVETLGGNARVVLTAADLKATRDERQAPLLKLHGSVDWETRDGSIVVNSDPEFAVNCGDAALTIASPGPSKAEATAGPVFSFLWAQAEEAIQAAHEIVFIGYRFPPTDAEARRRLLGAIAANRKQLRLQITIILGEPGPHTSRLHGLVEFACRRSRYPVGDPGNALHQDRLTYKIWTYPFYGQDFLTVFAGLPG